MTLSTYRIIETRGVNDIRDGELIAAKSLTQAKRIASKGQIFFGTWLHIECENGNHISRKSPESGNWEDTPSC